MPYYADDASRRIAQEQPHHSWRNEYCKTMSFLDDKRNHLTWNPVGADIAASVDLGYTYGTYEFESPGEDGTQTEYGKYTSIWKRQKEGSGKVVLARGNASPVPK